MSWARWRKKHPDREREYRRLHNKRRRERRRMEKAYTASRLSQVEMSPHLSDMVEAEKDEEIDMAAIVNAELESSPPPEVHGAHIFFSNTQAYREGSRDEGAQPGSEGPDEDCGETPKDDQDESTLEDSAEEDDNDDADADDDDDDNDEDESEEEDDDAEDDDEDSSVTSSDSDGTVEDETEDAKIKIDNRNLAPDAWDSTPSCEIKHMQEPEGVFSHEDEDEVRNLKVEFKDHTRDVTGIPEEQGSVRLEGDDNVADDNEIPPSSQVPRADTPTPAQTGPSKNKSRRKRRRRGNDASCGDQQESSKRQKTAETSETGAVAVAEVEDQTQRTQSTGSQTELITKQLDEMATDNGTSANPGSSKKGLKSMSAGNWPHLRPTKVFYKYSLAKQSQTIKDWMAKSEEYMDYIQAGALPISKVTRFFRYVVIHLDAMTETLDDVALAVERLATHHEAIQEEAKSADIERHEISELLSRFAPPSSARAALAQTGEEED
ncbi:hypothetical protein ABEF95_005737 [Exophiala dermatitidis]|nr:uncharacterized protein HMPREF1120_03022 [Exophiala dermatitidis NIH/UT8656]EHY54860.1 hypothetical protein HMPREF1120_03022 [Exophiala dermatitidis NIH/UT8656]